VTLERPNESLATILARIQERHFTVPEVQASPKHVDTPGAPSSSQSRTHRVTSTLQWFASSSSVPAEVFLETLGFFTPSSKRIRGISHKDKVIGTHTTADGRHETLRVTIRARQDVGLPITSDLDYYRAFLKMFAEAVMSSARFLLPLAAPTKRVVRYAGKTVTPRTLREVHTWLERMTCTEIIGAVYSAKQRRFLPGFTGTVFRRVVHRGETLTNGQIAATNYIWPAPWFLSNYLRGYVRTIDLALHQRLRRPIAKALYPLLATGWYASGGQPYAKRYRTLCADFLLRPERYLSCIQAQLDPAHRELQREGFVAHWTYRPAATGHDWVIRYWPGPTSESEQGVDETQRVCGHAPHTVTDDGMPITRTEQTVLLTEVLCVCGDPHNVVAYRTALQNYPVSLITSALTATRQAARKGRITKTNGAFFFATLHRLTRQRT
jgi:hypothetical protein